MDKTFQEIFSKRFGNKVARRVGNAASDPYLRRLLSFFAIGKILGSVLAAIDKNKIGNMVSIKKLGLAGSCTFSIGLISYTICFPAILKMQVKSQVVLKKGTEIRDFWEKLPQPLDFNIYVFNVTNPDDIKTGAKPILQEVGPFHYNLYRDKENVVDREEDDTVEYSMRQVWYFDPEKSAVSEDAEIYMIHPLILSIVLITQQENPSAMGVVNKAIASIFKKPDSMFVKTSVKEMFFYGLRIDCTVEDFAGSAVCGALEDKEEILVEESESVYRYGFLAKTNGSYFPQRIRVYRGIKNNKDVGRIVSVGNVTKMKVWPGNPCNDFRGTDGTIFPPFLDKKEEVWGHFPDICRSIGAYYVKPSKVLGFKTLMYTGDLGDTAEDEDMKCLCLESEGCPAKNMFFADPCMNAPIIISLPHFYKSDPRYLQMVDGLSPDQEKHMMFFHFEPLTGTPIKAYKRIQFNLMIEPIAKFKLMKSFPEALLPLFWVEDGVELGDVLQKPLKIAYMQILFAKVAMWLMMLGGIGMMAVAGMRYYREQNADDSTKNVTLPKSDIAPTVSTIQQNLTMPKID